MKKIREFVFSINKKIAGLVAVLCVLMILIGAFNALARYLGKFTGIQLSSNVYLELQWYLFSLIFLFGAAQTLKENAHVRVDVLYDRFSEKKKAWINLLGALLFFIPFCILMIVTSWPSVLRSWAVWEVSPDPGGLARYPIKTAVPIAFALLLLEGIFLIPSYLRNLKGHPSKAED